MISYRHDTGAWLNAAEDHVPGAGRVGSGAGGEAIDNAVMALEDLWI